MGDGHCDLIKILLPENHHQTQTKVGPENHHQSQTKVGPENYHQTQTKVGSMISLKSP